MLRRKNIAKAFLMAMVMSCTVQSTVFGAELSDRAINEGGEVAVPYWNSTSSVDVIITIDGTTVGAKTNIEAKNSGSSIKGFLCVDKYISGEWSRVAAWSFSGSGSVFCSKSYNGVAGAQYRVRVEATVDGETVSAVSGTETT